MFVFHNKTYQNKIIQIEQKDKMRQIFVGSVSHELRTPLNCQMTLLHTAERDPEVPKNVYEKYIQPSLKSSNYLLHLVNGILDYTQMTLNKQPTIIFENSRIAEVIDDVIDLLKMKADIRNVKLYSSIHPEVPDVFNTDPRRLK